MQRGLTAALRAEGQKRHDVTRIQAWAGQSAALGRSEPAGDATRRLWEEDARQLLA